MGKSHPSNKAGGRQHMNEAATGEAPIVYRQRSPWEVQRGFVAYIAVCTALAACQINTKSAQFGTRRDPMLEQRFLNNQPSD